MININRETSETQIQLTLGRDSNSESNINTGLPFFDHMLDQLVKHAQLYLNLEL